MQQQATVAGDAKERGSGLSENRVEGSRRYYVNLEFAINKDYKIHKILGKGTYGMVCYAVPSDEQEQKKAQPIAVKRVFNVFSNRILVRRAYREFSLMLHFRGHKNIVSILDLDYISEGKYSGLYCYQEYMVCDLAKLIQRDVEMSLVHVQSFAYQILCGVKYIHSANVIHRDLKPGNILVNSFGQLKICDFGLARGLAHPFDLRPQDLTIYVATRWYRAPELMITRTAYNTSIDLWSVGCILCELLGREPPFQGSDYVHQLAVIFAVVGSPSTEFLERMHVSPEIRKNIKDISGAYKRTSLRKAYGRYAPPILLDLITHLLDMDPVTRFTADKALAHPYFSPIRRQEDEPICDKKFDFTFERYNDHQMVDALKREIRKFHNGERGSSNS